MPRLFRHKILRDVGNYVWVDVGALAFTSVPSHYCSVNN